MKKSTWKKRTTPPERIREAIRTSREFNEAAAKLGIDRSTLHRWCEADPSLANVRAELGTLVIGESAQAASVGPDHWAQWVRATYDLSSTEQTLVDLAHRALALARDPQISPAHQLAAMGRFQRLVEQLDLERPPSGKTEDSRWPRLTVVK
jgi:hypothetical protein